MSLRYPLALAVLCVAASSWALAASGSMRIVNDWGGGFQAEVTVSNDGGATLSGWTVEFDMPIGIGNIWGGVVQSASGGHFVIGPADYTANVPPGGSVSFGFIGSPGNVSAVPVTVNGGAASSSRSSVSSSSSSVSSSSSSASSSSVSSSSSASSSTANLHQIVVRARGLAGTETIRLQVGGSTVQEWTLGTTLADHTAETALTGPVVVAFINDAGVDHDVQIDHIRIDGQIREAEDQAVNTGVWADGRCGGGGYSEWLHCNGQIDFGPIGAGSSSSSASGGSSSSSAACDLPATLNWTSSGPLIEPKNGNVSVKDPSIVRFGGFWHVFATVYNSNWASVYLRFDDFSRAGGAQHLPFAPGGSSTVAPQVFYFEPHGLWYLITQWPGRYSTNSDIADPNGWSPLRPLLAGEPSGALDFWLICSDTDCYLFFSRDDGALYLSKTPIGDFPNFSGYTTVMSGPRNVLFEAPAVYKLRGLNKYLLLVEGWESGPRFYRAWTATSLDGPWTPYRTSEAAPFAGEANVAYPEGRWTRDVSHGELLRAGYDQRMEIDACNLAFLYQGRDPAVSTDYDLLPYRLGLLRAQP